jgi:hypothetical protein
MSDQETIDALNKRTADNDVEILRLNGLLVDMQHNIDARTEAEQNLATVSGKINELTATNAKLLTDGQSLLQRAQALAVQVENLRIENGKLGNLYAAQNNYVLALESQAPDAVVKAQADLTRAQRLLQISQLQAML